MPYVTTQFCFPIDFQKQKAYQRDTLPASVKLSFGDVQVDGNTPPKYSYRMAYHSPHGIAVIINNINFPGEDQRYGTEIDEKNLSETFRFLGYNVEIYRDRQKRETENIFRDLVKRDGELKGHDSFVCCILSHGRDGEIIATDGKPVRLNSITEELKDCQQLRGKPKMFFIQACRGRALDGRIDEDEAEALNVPTEADFFFIYATPPGYAAWRNVKDGSYYIKVLCETFCKYAKNTNLAAMHIIINHDVSKDTIEVKNDKGKITKYREIPEFHDRLRAFVYFFKQI